MMDITEARRIARHLESGGKVEDRMQVRRAFWKLESMKGRTVEERRENIRLAQICWNEVGKWND